MILGGSVSLSVKWGGRARHAAHGVVAAECSARPRRASGVDHGLCRPCPHADVAVPPVARVW